MVKLSNITVGEIWDKTFNLSALVFVRLRKRI